MRVIHRAVEHEVEAAVDEVVDRRPVAPKTTRRMGAVYRLGPAATRLGVAEVAVDPGAKVFIFFTGGAAVVASAWWLFRKVFGLPAVDPTGPKASDTWESRAESTEPRDRL